MKELKTLLGELPNSEVQLLVWGELLKATLAGDGVTFGQLAARLPETNKGSISRTLKTLEGKGMAERVLPTSSGCDRATPEVAIEQPDHTVFKAAKANEITKFFSGLLSLAGKASCSKATKTTTLLYKNKKSVSEDVLNLKQGEEGPLQKGPVLSAWFKEIDYKRLERKLPSSAKEFARIHRLEQACLNTMYAGYYKTYGADPFLRTRRFCEEYARAWENFLPRIPCLGEKAILGKKFTDSAFWPDLVEARRQADRNNAKYDEWVDAIFKRYRDNPLPHRATPTPKYFKTPKAAEIYAGYYADLYLGGTRDLFRPIWSKDEHDLTCPIQISTFQNFCEELKAVAKLNSRPAHELFDEAVRAGSLPLDYVKKYHKDIADKICDEKGEVRLGLVEELGL
ncbi:MAG: MarR family transcriptional regulator [Desulfarculaceae bacterium]|nr:MarR family transcriptional regulator [Desulfarculaceae bacterium]